MTPARLSSVATVVLIGVVVYLVLTWQLFARGVVGMSIQGAALALMVWARLTFGIRSFHAAANPTRGGLVMSGPYRLVRHPIYAAILLFVSTGVLSNWTPLTISLGFVTAMMLAIRAVCEEILLVDMYPEYVEYARRTARLIPLVF